MDFFDSIGSRLKNERERLGKSQTEIASIAESAGAPGATRQSQALYEKGKRMPDAAYLAAIAAAGADVLYILTGQRVGAVTASVAAYLPPLSSTANQGTASAAAYCPPLSPQALTEDEDGLLKLYRGCSPDGKTAITQTSLALAKSAKGLKKKAA